MLPSSIYCPDQTCNKTSDWLTYVPNGAAGWTIGAICLALNFLLVKRTKLNKWGFVFIVLPDVYCCLAISLFLRASLSLDSNAHKDTCYLVSLFFNYFSAVVIAQIFFFQPYRVLLAANRLDIEDAERLHEIEIYRRYYLAIELAVTLILGNLVYFALIALSAAAAGTMFKKINDQGVDISMYMTRYVDAMIMIFGVILAATPMSSIFSNNEAFTRLSFWKWCVASALFLLWSIFMYTRTYMPLTNVVRNSEVIFYMFNYAPLIVLVLFYRYIFSPAIAFPSVQEQEQEQQQQDTEEVVDV